MKTAMQKAIELVNKYNNILPCEGLTTGQSPIDCALICVHEILNALEIYPEYQLKQHEKDEVNYWKEVKQQLEKM